MSYDIRLKDRQTGETCIVAWHDKHGGTYQVGGTDKAWLNITYNYASHFKRVFGANGIRSIYGMTGEDSLPVLFTAIAKLGTDVSDDYWEATEGNARKALADLVYLAMLCPNGVWDGD